MARRALVAFILCAGLVACSTPQHSGRDADVAVHQRHWVASWATAPGSYFAYAPPLPQNQALGLSPTRFAVANTQPDLAFPFPNAAGPGAAARDQTFRSIIKPDLWARFMRVRFSNVFGNQPLSFNAVTLALQEYGANVVPGTVTALTFKGSHNVSIPPGEEVFSDGVLLPWVDDQGAAPLLQGRNLAVSYSVRGDSGRMTFHSAANQTSFITGAGSGDHTADVDGFAFDHTTTSWFFLSALDVMAAQDTVVVCVFGDSITDGTHTTLNVNDRWANVLSRRLHAAYGNKVSVVNAAISGNRVIGPVVPNAPAGPAAVDRLQRDVLGLSGLTHVIWLEGINDLGAGYGQAVSATPRFEVPVVHTPDNIIAGYQSVIGRLRAQGIKVYGGTLISARGLHNPAQGWDLDRFPNLLAAVANGSVIDGHRKTLNHYIRTSGLYDGVVDFDAATLDPVTGNLRAAYLPNSEFTQLPWDYLHPNRAGHNAMGLAIDIAPFTPYRRQGDASEARPAKAPSTP